MSTHTQTLSLLLLLLLLLLLSPLPSLSSTSFHFHPQDNYLLTVGPTSPLLSSNPNCTHIIAPTFPPNHPFSFSFPLSSPGPHLLRLHLLLPLISATASSFPLLSHSPAVGPSTKEFLFPNLRLASLPLSLSPSSSFSAIELYSVPDALLPSSAELVGHVLEVVHRVNVGGPRVTPDNDTLWRTWVGDDEGFYIGGGVGKVVRFFGRLNWAEGGATPLTAPETVYGTCREMGNSSLDSFNLTWILPVSNSNHGYLIRLHFCDIVSKALYELYFDVYINGNSAYKDLDLSSQSYALASPYYIDFTVSSNPSGKIHISVGPSQRSLPWKINAILNGLEIMKINGITKFSEPKKKKDHVGILIGSILGSFVFLCLLMAFVLTVLRRRQKKQKPISSESRVWSPLELTATSHGSTRNLSLKIPISELLIATNNFDENYQIGSGGFGKVYKGVLRDGTLVAVKRCNNDNSSNGYRQGLTEFKSEILILTKIRHRHLVSLIGFCDDRSEMILIYEFMKNGPLRDNLYGSTKTKPHLSWKQRLEICIGSARGLHYLHTGTEQGTIIHRDVKSTNILLDENYTAKVADFGLSKTAGPHHIEQTHVSTGVKGSFGYLDPEYFRTQQITDKSDVYSFGVVLLEVLCARNVIDRSLSWEEVNLAEWGTKLLKKGNIEKIIDQKLRNEIDDKSLKKFGEIVEKCLAQYGVDRPTMGDVLWNLESVLQVHEAAVTVASEGNLED